MPVNKNHTERIAALEQHKEDTLNLPRRIKEMEDEQSNQEISIENLHARLEEIERKFPDLRQLKLYQTTNEKNVTLLFERMDNSINILTDLHNRLNHVERETPPSKKNTKNISIAQLVKALLFIPFTTLKG
jgi:uncharacterized coiled-coil protein SlyX